MQVVNYILTNCACLDVLIPTRSLYPYEKVLVKSNNNIYNQYTYSYFYRCFTRHGSRYMVLFPGVRHNQLLGPNVGTQFTIASIDTMYQCIESSEALKIIL